MRDLNIPIIDEVPDVSAGEGLFSTDVNSQSALSYANGAEQTVLDPTKANANPTIDPAFLAYLMESQKNVAPSNTTLPPNYYYPDANRGVTVGQMSGPLGSMSLITPGAPLFPMSVMDAVQKEDEANKQKWLEEQLKPIKPEKYTVPLLKNTAWNNRWVKWANKQYDDPTKEYLDKYDDATMARTMLERDGVFQKASDKIAAYKSLVDDAEIHAEDILKQDPTKQFYRAPAVIEAAEEWRATAEALDFDDPKSWDKIVKAKNKMYMAEALETSTKPILDGINQSILMDGIFEQAYSKSVGADGKVNMTALKTNVDQAYITFKKTGLNAFPDIDAKINAMYEAKYPTESPSNPTLEVFKNFIISSAKVGVEEQFQKMTTDNVWERLAAAKKTDETKIRPAKQPVKVNGKSVDMMSVDYSGMPYFQINNVPVTSIDPNTGAAINTSLPGTVTSEQWYIDPDTGKEVRTVRVSYVDPYTKTIKYQDMQSNEVVNTVIQRGRQENGINVLENEPIEYQQAGTVTSGNKTYSVGGDSEWFGVKTNGDPTQTHTVKPSPARPLPRPY